MAKKLMIGSAVIQVIASITIILAQAHGMITGPIAFSALLIIATSCIGFTAAVSMIATR